MGAPPGMQQLRRTCSSTGEGLRPASLWLPPRTVEPQACFLAPLQKMGRAAAYFPLLLTLLALLYRQNRRYIRM